MSEPLPPQDSPEVAAAVRAIEAYWGTMAQSWPWMRQQSLRPVYILAGELLIALIRHFPALLQSNQANWYARQIAGTPSIYVLFPEQFQEEARKRLGTAAPQTLEGKQAITFIYLAAINGQTQVAKTLLLSTEKNAPMFRAQVAHELLNCACAATWHDDILQAGLRQVHWKAGAPLQRGGNLNDLIIDTLLVDFLPAATTYTRGTLLDGPQGPYWQIVAALSAKLPQAAMLAALFGDDQERQALENLLNEVFERGDAALWLDRLIANRDWHQLAQAIGAHEEHPL